MKLLIFLLCILNFNFAISQICPTGSVFINSQAQADAFALQYPDCQELPAALNIMGADVNSLIGFKNIKSIQGEFTISNTESLFDLEGLNSLERINGFIRIQNNPGLISLRGLENLKYLNSEFFYISSNPRMKSLDGLQSLDSIAGKFQIYFLDSLENIEGLSNLQFVGDDLMIFNNALLTNLNGLGNLRSINALRVYENPQLSDISSLSSELKIIEWLVLRDNPILSECEVTAVCEHLSDPDSKAGISGNMAGCSSRAEIELACKPSNINTHSPIEVKVYPNPTNSKLYIDGETSAIRAEILNLQGQRSYHIINNGSIDTEILPNGIYFGKIYTPSFQYYFKFYKN